jgi:hypothetical protein
MEYNQNSLDYPPQESLDQEGFDTPLIIKEHDSPSFGRESEAAGWKIVDKDDDYRHPNAWKDGGFPLNDQEAITKFRNAFKHLLSSVGR